ncbi:hypothetical protein AN964_24080 [Heyndrickxia shackletonii]|uniref:Uncharacterized protein n=1 Tax=Heyndrickxia shackletonii TaxID=157838 RepID=A0A0Q3T9J6_9BACI|nr:hypothetical protein [Heyndrickxia shackletonii]KQL50710.1 hypothetical protein AN964_24080 [Heyndrickxia shackletonii]MBB2482929.1 hypothetical protein [Bacillus sp. APMAM]NEY97953.1 hypothetical protein [Heyndrickxia shackletonii]RTZ53621.1 hypothetical protein EKO25_22320 [Bacillus sp. SAJ1]
MRDIRTLKFLDKFSGLFQKFGVDYPAMRKILQVKLIMDQRRVPTIFSQGAQSKKKKAGDDGNGFLKSLWLYAFFGLLTIPFIVLGENYLFQMSIMFGFVMFIVMTSMISDFSSVLLDIRDKNILHTRPIDKKTISAAKMMHVFIYLFYLTGSIVAIPLIVGLFRHGIIFFLLSIILIILMEAFILVITALIYMLILKFFDGEKLKDIINYVQIGLSFSIMIGYQVLGRSFEFINFHVVLTPKWWQVFIIPMWFGAPYELILNGHFDSFYVLFSILAIVVPIIAFFIYLRLVPAFEKNLQKLATHSVKKEKKRSKLESSFIKMICSGKEEQAFFRFASLMMKNERDFKLKVYPSLGFAIILPFIFLFNSLRDGGFSSISSGKGYLTIYSTMIIIPSVITMLKFSGKYKGAWIYKALPLDHLSPLFKGTLKAFLVRLYLPLHLVLCILFIAIFGVRVIPDLILVFLISAFYSIVCFIILKKVIPFSESFESVGQTESWKIFVLMIPIAIFAVLHYLSTLASFGVYIYIFIMLVANLFLWKKRIRA